MDLAIRIGALPDRSLKANRVGSIRHVVCGSLGYFARRGKAMGFVQFQPRIGFDADQIGGFFSFMISHAVILCICEYLHIRY